MRQGGKVARVLAYAYVSSFFRIAASHPGAGQGQCKRAHFQRKYLRFCSHPLDG